MKNLKRALAVAVLCLPILAWGQGNVVVTVTHDITFSTTTKGPVTCDLAMDRRFIITENTAYPPSSSSIALQLAAIVLERQKTAHVVLTLEVGGEDGSSAAKRQGHLNLKISGNPSGEFVVDTRTGKNTSMYDFGVTSGAYSGSMRITGSFPDGVIFSMNGITAGQSPMYCFGHGTVEVILNGTLSQ